MLASHMRLNDIIVFEASGRRRGGFEEEPPPALTGEVPNVTGHFRLRGKEAFDARFRLELVTDDYHLVADISAEYRIEEVEELPDQESLSEFGVTSGLLHVWPFLRESLRTSATRLGVEVPVLPLTLVNGAEAIDTQ